MAAENKSPYPIVLVHGFSGWGRDELLGYKYWGGFVLDIEEYLKSKGFVVISSSVGAISSNHDRACELFYQLKGGQVDYGMQHAQTYGHQRFGKSFDALYPEWDQTHPIHLIGHSMGGQTCRMLVELLEQDYFGKGTTGAWIKSVTTISTPHNGTTLATMVQGLSGGLAEEIVAGFLGITGSNWRVYDFDMEHWNIKPLEGESMKDYLHRIDVGIGDTKDISMYDLLPEGALVLNARIRTCPTIYYFSYATEETKVILANPGYHWPKASMNPIFWAYAHYMGHYQGSAVKPCDEWWQNDGIVNTISMQGPHNAKIQAFDGTPKAGVWNYMGVLSNMDHGKVIGHYRELILGKVWMKKFYEDLATMLVELP